MATVAVRTQICNAATVFGGLWGAVTGLASRLGCSRQALYQQAGRIEQAVVQAHESGPSRSPLRQRVEHLEEENRQLWQALENAVDFAQAKQQQFTATATALGLSLSQVAVLLAVVLSAGRVPSRATLGRWAQQAARRAGRLLEVLDGACQALVLTLCLDEIFLRRQPVLMGVEPASLAWLLGRRAADRSGLTWDAALAPWERLTYAVVDGGSGLRRGLELTRQRRQEAGPARPLAVNLDNFHIQREGRRALRREWQQAERVWVRAEQADRDLAEAGRQGRKVTGLAVKARAAWAQAERAFLVAQRQEAACRRVAAALELFRPDGQLSTRPWAEAELRAAVGELPGPRWAKFGRMALDPRALTFVDRLHDQLAEAEPRAELRAAVVALWRARHPRGAAAGSSARAERNSALVAVRSVVCQQLDPAWPAAYRRVAAVLGGVVRASSVVECLNSVVRMHQARHRGLSQGLIDLKRLYWNCRTFAEGKRKDHCPYEHVGLALPTYDWWELLPMDPTVLEQKLSTAGVAA
jgi:hypothetical protein